MMKFTSLDETIGQSYTVEIVPCDDNSPPWENEDGHGPVSEWTTRAKLPGEVILCNDRSKYRYYDMQKDCQIARRDDWGFLPSKPCRENGKNGLLRLSVQTYNNRRIETIATNWHDDINNAYSELYTLHKATFPTARAYHAAAAQRDYERLREWCNGSWEYVGIIVSSSTDDEVSLFGIESDDDAYLLQVANELLEELRDCHD